MFGHEALAWLSAWAVRHEPAARGPCAMATHRAAPVRSALGLETYCATLPCSSRAAIARMAPRSASARAGAHLRSRSSSSPRFASLTLATARIRFGVPRRGAAGHSSRLPVRGENGCRRGDARAQARRLRDSYVAFGTELSAVRDCSRRARGPVDPIIAFDML